MPPTPSTEFALAELTRASSLLESTIASLQQRASPPTSRLKHTPSPSIIDGLTTVRHLLACIEDDAPALDDNASGRVSYPGTARKWDSLFHARFEVCITSCDVISGRVGLGGQPDCGTMFWDGGEAGSDGMDTFNVVVEKLGEGLRVLARAENLDVQEQDELLESRAVEDLFLQLGRCSAKLAEGGSKRRDGAGLPALLQNPLRWVGILRGSRGEEGEKEQEDSLADLMRVRTWPPGLKISSTDLELREARRWSRAIGRRLVADGFDAKRLTLSAMLFSPYCCCWRTDHKTKLLLVDGLASQSTNTKLEAANKVNLPGAREAVRRNLLREAERVISHLQGTRTLGEEFSDLCDGALSAIRRLSRTLDEEMGQLLRDVWKSKQFQEALREKSSGSRWHNDVLISTIDRASAKNYIPTLIDYRRFWVDQRYAPLVGTFKFDIDPVSIRILDPKHLSHTERMRKLNKEFWAESTSILVPIDLAQYEACDCWPDEGVSRGPGRLAQMAFALSSIAQCRRESHPISFIFIMMNKEGLRAKFDRISFSSIYSDYEGCHDSPEDVIQYTIDRICAAFDTSNDKERMPIESYCHIGEPWEETTLKFILTALKDSKTIQELVASGVVKGGKA